MVTKTAVIFVNMNTEIMPLSFKFQPSESNTDGVSTPAMERLVHISRANATMQRMDSTLKERDMAAEIDTLLTEEGIAWLKQEIDELRDEKLPELEGIIQASAQDGDLNDNSEWEASKDEYVQAQERLEDLELLLAHAKLPTPDENGAIVIGSRAAVRTAAGEEFTWVLVNPVELAVSDDRISIESPVGQALMGKTTGDSASVTTPEGDVAYTVVAVN